MDRRLNEESTFTFHVPATSKKLSELGPESRIIAGDREFVILKPDAMDTVRDDAGQTWTKVMAVESWKLLGKTYPTINNDPYYPWPPDRKGDAYNDPDHGWIIPDALVVCIVSGGDNLSGGLYQTGTAAHALHVLLKDTGWTLGTVDVTGTYDLETEKESTLANIQEVQKIWGGMLVWEYVFDDNDKIVERKLHLRNEDTWRNYTGFQIRYAKNLKHITRTDNNDIVTRLYAFGENDLDIYAINDGKKYVENYSYTDEIWWGIFQDQKIHEQQELKEKAEKALAKMCRPRRTYRIKMADLRTLPEYQHEDFQLGDVVDVIDEDLNINLQARIVRHRHNVFMPWQCELEVGEPEERLVSSLKDSFDIAKYVKETVRPNRGISQIIKGILNTFHTAIQGANGDFDVVDGVATWWETDENGERTGNLVRITPGGILISDDGGQTSQLAITGEGIAAEAVIGTLGMFAKVKADQIIIGSQGEGISEELIAIGPDTTFAEGYDPTDNHLYFQYSADGATGWHDTFNPATDKYMRQKVGDDGTWSDPMRVVGEDGKDGYTPVKGVDYFDGVDGTSAYLWVRYSQNSDGDPMTTDPTGAKYIGIATTTTASAPTDYTDYSWSLIKGTDGIPGEPGEDGRTSYLHIKYSDDGVTFTANNGETPGAYIGTYVDFNPVDSTDFSDYTWNKVRGEDGQDVRKFTSQPVPPYDVGDLWIGGSDGKNTLICVTARESGDFVASDWKPMTAPDVLKVDNRCKALFHFDGSINDHRGIMPTFTRNSKAYLSDGTEVDAGVPRFEQGKFDKAVLVEEGTTNLCTNPSFETDLTGWVHIDSGTSSRVTDQKYYGNACLKISTTDTENTAQLWYVVANPGNYAGKTVSLSCMVKTSIADKLRLRIREHDGNNYKWSDSSYHPGDGTWKKLSLTTTLRSTVTDLRLQLVAGAGIIGDFWCDGVLFEEKPYPTSFTPSTRSAETLTIPTAGVLNPQEGAVALYLYVNPAHREPSKTRRFFGHLPGPGNANRISMQHNDANYWLFTIGDANGNAHSLNIADNEVADGWRQFVMKWGAEEFAVYVDGIKKANLLNPTYLPSSVGDIITVSEYTNALLDDLAIFDYAPTDEEIQAWYEADAPFYALDLPKPELPGYVKIESDGLRVYDNTGKLRGVFGSWLKELIRKYGIKIIDGEIYSTMFQTGEEGASDYIRLSSDASQPLLVVNDNKDALSIWAGNGGGFIQFFDSSADSMRGQILPHNDADGVGLRVQARSQSSLNYALSLYGMAGIEMHGDVWVHDDLRVFGDKPAVMLTENYGQRLLYSYETPESKFMDEGVGELASGACRIDIDPIFLETIEPNTPETPFIVHLTPYDWLNLRVKEIGDTYFIVEEKEGLSGKFSWQLTATRKGYAGRRLDRIDEEDVLTSNWEDDLNGFLEQEG